MKLIKLKDVMNLTSLSRATIYRFMAQQQFPKQVVLSARSVVWRESEIIEWIEEKCAERD
ncbi:AlpA family transcriptional regulator [Parashewanella spongiae]|nr:AlpA family phage regulatory protein [Parashewanella spongiae]MCL1077047.1 AlpA family transcriptional regulator [Parashewanella spongiae]